MAPIPHFLCLFPVSILHCHEFLRYPPLVFNSRCPQLFCEFPYHCCFLLLISPSTCPLLYNLICCFFFIISALSFLFSVRELLLVWGGYTLLLLHWSAVSLSLPTPDTLCSSILISFLIWDIDSGLPQFSCYPFCSLTSYLVLCVVIQDRPFCLQVNTLTLWCL